MKNTVSAGIRLYTGTTQRLADGIGSTESNYDISIKGNYPKDIHFKSNNIAAFVENIFRISDKLYVIPGIRNEWLEGSASGRNGFSSLGDAINLQNIKRTRSFLLGGIGSEYHLTKSTEIYSNYSQAYRPIQFSNLQSPPTTDTVDSDLKDSKGFNFDIGYRGKLKNYLQFDISAYMLQYNNRVGTITTSGTNYRLITNVGRSISKGIESYIEFNPLKAFTNKVHTDLILFSSYAFTNAKYSGDHKDASTKDKNVENAPQNIVRAGISFGYKEFLFTTQFSFVGSSFSDANNTIVSSENGNIGLIPSYSITDITTSFKFSKNFNIKAGINNLGNKRYFTRRAGGYPGPGAMPADGRTFFLSLGAKL
jgi:Fe(3+) dicitrate transport protein